MKKVSEYAHRFMTILSMLFFACTLGMMFEFSVKGESILFIRNFFLYQESALHYLLFIAAPLLFLFDLMLDFQIIRKPEWSDFFNSLALSFIGAILVILLIYLLQTDVIKINHIFLDAFIVFINLFALIEMRKIAIKR